MNRLILLCLIGITAYSCGNNIKKNVKISTMSEIQKMDNVIEISLWDCENWNDINVCKEPIYWDSTSDKQKISSFMSVIREIKIVPIRGSVHGQLICFKDSTGKVLCTDIEREDDKTIYGSDYKDETGKLSEALVAVFSGCEDKTKPCPATMAEIQKMNNVVRISLRGCNGLKNGNEFFDLKEERASTSEKQKIADIMSAIREVEIVPGGIMVAITEVICFEDPNGQLFCTTISIGYETDKTTVGEDYIDKSGKLYDALKSAGLINP
jgi:hypothetical protein